MYKSKWENITSTAREIVKGACRPQKKKKNPFTPTVAQDPTVKQTSKVFFSVWGGKKKKSIKALLSFSRRLPGASNKILFVNVYTNHLDHMKRIVYSACEAITNKCWKETIPQQTTQRHWTAVCVGLSKEVWERPHTYFLNSFDFRSDIPLRRKLRI